MSKAGIYIHFPFCRRACFYCHFFKKRFLVPAAADWLRLLKREMRLRRDPRLDVDSLYFGGGSPSLLNAGQVRSLLEAAAKHFRVAAGSEVTLEANPEDLSPPLLKDLRSAGVNRLSIGAQSFQQRDLCFLRRAHDAQRTIAASTMARDAGFRNVSLDLIIGLSTQTAASIEINFRTLEALQPSHVSLYILENVPRPEDGGHDARLYHQARQALAALGFTHYEVSNFARPGKASRHNLKYWRMQPYVGLGPSAAGFLGGRDYRNVADMKRYAAAVRAGQPPLIRTAPIDPAKRRIVTGLRLLAGIPASAFSAFPSEAAFLLREEFLARRGRHIAVPEEKILLLNEIAGYFV